MTGILVTAVAYLVVFYAAAICIFVLSPRLRCRLGVHSRKSAGRNPDGSVTHSGPCQRCGAQMDAEVFYPRGDW